MSIVYISREAIRNTVTKIFSSTVLSPQIRLKSCTLITVFANGGPSKVVVDGYYILTEPLTKGTYPIHFKSSLLCPDPGCAEPNFAQDIQYTIVAE